MEFAIFLTLLVTVVIIFYVNTTKRQRTWLSLKFSRVFASEKRIRFPKNMTESEKIASEIFIYLLKDHSSKLYYDIVTSECFISDANKTIFTFLESKNLKIINTVYGYDTYISSDTELYLSNRFRRELTTRRKMFKEEAILKVEYSLCSTLNKLKANNIQNNEQDQDI